MNEEKQEMEQRFEQARSTFVEAQAGFTNLVAMVLTEVDRLPLEDRATGRLTFFLQAAAGMVESDLSAPAIPQFRRLVQHTLDHIENLQQADAQDSLDSPEDIVEES